MVQYRNFLLEARDILQDKHMPVRDRLARAGRLFWQAYVYQGSRWSKEFQDRGGQVLTRLVSRGHIRATADTVDEPTAAALCREMMEFIDALEATE
jgi:hypothetical protein